MKHRRPEKRAIILAAGKGTRLVNGFPFPKPLKRVGGVPLIVRILRGLEAGGGVTDVAIIIGHLGEKIVEALERYSFRMSISFVENDEFDKPNGTSLLKARDFVTGPTFVLMSDHLWSPSLLQAVDAFPLGDDEAVLGVDYRIDRCFDLDDATKAKLDGDRIVDIGKEIPAYDALDTGVFRITPALMDALADAEGEDGCSLSAGVGTLAARGKMRTVDVGASTWIDVDTPAAHRIAEKLLAAYGDDLEAPHELSALALAAGA